MKLDIELKDVKTFTEIAAAVAELIEHAADNRTARKSVWVGYDILGRLSATLFRDRIECALWCVRMVGHYGTAGKRHLDLRLMPKAPFTVTGTDAGEAFMDHLAAALPTACLLWGAIPKQSSGKNFISG